MQLFFIQEAVYFKCKGVLYSPRISYETYWRRYLEHFEVVNVVARVREVEELQGNYHVASGERINFIPLPYYNGVFGYILRRKKINCIFKNLIINNNAAFILRVPGPLGFSFSNILYNAKYKYVVEVVGDPHEVIRHLNLWMPVKLLLMRLSLLRMKKCIGKASGVLYVTQNQLQEKYPKPENSFTVEASNVVINDNDVVKRDKEQFIRSIETRLFNKSLKPVRIGVLGMLYPIKSPIEIVQAIKFLINDGFNVELVFAGDGPLKNEILNIAIHYSITDRVHCLGSITNVKAFLDDVDLFIQFSKTEGVPRALLEAMSRGCLVISSNVGGVPEFLHSDFLVESQDIRGLYNKIKALLLDKHLMFNNLDNNYNISKLNTVSVLNKKRSEFYKQVYNLYTQKNITNEK